MSRSGDELLQRWSHIQGWLFPWLREEVGELTAQHERIVLVLDSLGLETHVPGPPGGREPLLPDRSTAGSLAPATGAEAAGDDRRVSLWT